MTDDYKVTTVNNTIYFIGEIDLKSVDELVRQLHKLEDNKKDSTDKNIKLYVTSCGGSTTEGLKIYDILNTINLDITIS